MSPSGLNFGLLSPIPPYEEKLSMKNKHFHGVVMGGVSGGPLPSAPA